MTKRRRFADQFKAKVARDGLRGDRVIREIAARHRVRPNRALWFTHEEVQSGLWLVASREAYQDPRVRKFMEYFDENFPKDGRAVNV